MAAAAAPPPPFAALHADDPAAADDARARLRAPRSPFAWAHLPRRRRESAVSSASESEPEEQVTAEAIRASTPTTPVELPTPSAALDEDKDVYRWCVLYENQRGITLFSTAYYSALTLLPMDPPAFTVPLPGRGRQPAVSLTEFPLPDGTWRWASRAWMVDMRADGAVAHDGFEYNACFRARGWSAVAGARGFVRRRRWVRLMMRPAQHPPPADVPAPAPGHDHETEGAAEERVWCGDPAADWARCHAQLRRAGRDGVRLELWATWLGGAPPPARAKQWTEDSRLMPSEALVQTATQATLVPSPEGTRDAIAAVLRDHGPEIMHLFVYPDSRAQFLALLARAGVLPAVADGALADMADFWSYTHALA